MVRFSIITFLSLCLLACGSDSNSDKQVNVDSQIVLQGLVPIEHTNRTEGLLFREIVTKTEFNHLWLSLISKQAPEFDTNASYVLFQRGEVDASPCTDKINLKRIETYISEGGSLVVRPILQQECPDTDPNTVCDAIYVGEYPYYLLKLDAKADTIIFQQQKLPGCS